MGYEKRRSKEGTQGAWKLAVSAFLVTLTATLALFAAKGLAPFGTKTCLASQDGFIQFLDLFSYGKDVLAGKNSISYSFSSTLGQTNVGVFAYYLASPVNLLLLLFPKKQMASFYDLAVLVKLALAALTMSLFLRFRFLGRLRIWVELALAFSYAWMQYSFSQACNVIWLDGIYMLPLILLGVSQLVREGEGLLLPLAVGCGILFQWYTAGINCLFAGFWFLFELGLSWAEKREEDLGLAGTLGRMGSFLRQMAVGILLGGILFLPMALSMRNGKGGSFDWDLLQNSFFGKLAWALFRYASGTVSEKGRPALYCGMLVFLGAAGVFLARRISLREKIIYGLMLLFCLLLFIWQPLFALFSLLKSVVTYYYRYAYVAIFYLVFLAGVFFSRWEETRQDTGRVLLAGILYDAQLLARLLLRPENTEGTNVYASCAFALAIGILLKILSGRERGTGKAKGGSRRMQAAAVALGLCLAADLWGNAWTLLEKNHMRSVRHYREYTSHTIAQIEEIKRQDAGIYRISQTSTRDRRKGNLTLNYNESLAFQYWGILSYTSCAEESQRIFLERIGYRRESGCINILDTTVLAADALLGVKYILSPYEVKGLEELEGAEEYEDKKAYRNPYAFPLAFLGPGEDAFADTGDPFAYLNQIYESLTGETVFLPVKSRTSRKEKGISVTLTGIDPANPVYANLPWTAPYAASIRVNGAYRQSYACWLSPSVFYVPADRKKAKLVIETEYPEIFGEGQYYQLSLEALQRAATQIQSQPVEIREMENGRILAQAQAKEGQNLILSVPCQKGWEIRRNGERIEPGLFAEALLEIPLEEGLNELVLTYHVPGRWAGLACSLVGLAALWRMGRRKKSRLADGTIRESIFAEETR